MTEKIKFLYHAFPSVLFLRNQKDFDYFITRRIKSVLSSRQSFLDMPIPTRFCFNCSIATVARAKPKSQLSKFYSISFLVLIVL